MNVQSKVENGPADLVKADPNSPCIKVLGKDQIAIKAGTKFGSADFAEEKIVPIPVHLIPGTDYYVICTPEHFAVEPAFEVPDVDALGGFHFAPGGNATARDGGDETPAINPFSIWDRNFRPACPDPRGMTQIELPNGDKPWIDIYLLGKDHLINGTSKLGVTIADGNDAPQNPDGGYFKRFDYPAAVKVYAHHGKQLLSAEESFAAYIGGKEKTSCERDPKMTKCDAARTSQRGVMQPFGSMLQWGHDGDPDEPRPSLFGGSWISGSFAGSRFAFLDVWAGYSNGHLGARGRSDHLQPA